MFFFNHNLSFFNKTIIDEILASPIPGNPYDVLVETILLASAIEYESVIEEEEQIIERFFSLFLKKFKCIFLKFVLKA